MSLVPFKNAWAYNGRFLVLIGPYNQVTNTANPWWKSVISPVWTPLNFWHDIMHDVHLSGQRIWHITKQNVWIWCPFILMFKYLRLFAIFQVTGQVTCLTLAFLSYDRYRVVVRPFNSLRHRSSRQVWMLLLAMWSGKYVHGGRHSIKFFGGLKNSFLPI